MSTRSEPPLEAKVLPDVPPPRHSGSSNAWNWLLATSAFLGFVALFAILLWGTGRLISGGRQLAPGRHGSIIQRWETPSERLAAIKSTLETSNVGCSPAELREFDRFFARVAESTGVPAAAQFDALTDLDALTDRVLRHPALDNVERRSRERLRRLMEHDSKGLPRWTKFSIVNVTRGASGEALVYTIAVGYENNPSPVRWWLKRHGRSWRICDWERIDVGYSEAGRRALDEALLARGEEPAFRRAMSAIQGAITNRRANNVPLAVQQLLDVQASQLPDLAGDLVNIELASVWLMCSRPDQAIAACDRVEHPEINPAVHYYRSQAHAEREQFAETVASAVAYRKVAGRHPHLLELEADALEALGQSREAAQCWHDCLALNPSDRHALMEYCRLAGDERSVVLTAVLERSREPLELALAAGSEAARDQDEATYDAIVQFLQAKTGGPAAIERLAGERLRHSGEHQRAAEHFRKAYQQASEAAEHRRCFEQFLETMAESGRASAGYAEASDPEEAFTFLTQGFEDDESLIRLDDLPLLLAARRQRVPADARLHYFQGLLDLAEGRAAEAEQAFAAGETTAAEDELRERLRTKRLEALFRQGLLADAYRIYSADHSLVFRELGWLCRGERNWPALDELIRLHRREQADDPWIDYFLALRYQAEGDDAEALAAARRAEAAHDPTLTPQLGWLKDNLLIRVEGITQAYLSSSDQRESFRRLVGHLAAAEDWDGILELTELHSNSGGGGRRSSTIYWAAKAQWNCGEYEKIVASLSPWPYDRLSRLDGEQLAELYDIVVRSLVRLGRFDEASDTARQARDEYGLELPQMAVALAKNDRPGVAELLTQRRIARALFHRQLYRDRDLASLLTDPDVASIRRQHALAWPHEFGQRNVSLVLFYEHPLPAAEIEACRQLAAGLGDANEIVAADGRKSWLWQVGADSLAVTHASGPYCSCAELPAWLAAEDPRRAILEQHGAWVAVDLFLADQAIRNSRVRPAAASVAAALARGARACYVVGPRGRAGEPQLIDEAVLHKIASGNMFRAEPGGTLTWDSVFLSPPPVAQRASGGPLQLQLGLTRLAHASRVANERGYALIRVRPTRGHAAEDLWLKVIRTRRESYASGPDGEEFIAEVTSDSRLWPHLKTGERLMVGLHEPLEIAPVEPETASESSPMGR